MFKKFLTRITGGKTEASPESSDIILGDVNTVRTAQQETQMTTPAPRHERRSVPDRVFQHTPNIKSDPLYFVLDGEIGAYVNHSDPTEVKSLEELEAIAALKLEVPPISTELPKFVFRRTGVMPAFK